MLGKVKKWFGIEGLKIALRTEEKYERIDGVITGMIVLKASSFEEVEHIRIKLIEKYARGRGKNRLIDEYKMADETFHSHYEVEANLDFEIPFELEYDEMISQMDVIQRKNFVFSGIVSAAKFFKKAKSTYRIEIEAKVKGTKFSPFASQDINLV